MTFPGMAFLANTQAKEASYKTFSCCLRSKQKLQDFDQKHEKFMFLLKIVQF